MATYDDRIDTGTDDAYLYTGSSFFNNSGNSVYMGNTYEGYYRFVNLPMGPGSTINSATLTFHTHQFGSTNPLHVRIYGFDEDNTATFSSNPTSRPKTTAYVDIALDPWQTDYDWVSADISSIIQEIVDRAGWAATNAIGFIIVNNGSSFGSEIQTYEYASAEACRLQIDYTGITTSSRTIVATAKIDNPLRDVGIKIMKPTYDVLRDNDPSHQIFNSDYGTLKYALSGSLDVTLPADDIGKSASVTHNLGYKPYVEVYVEDLQSPGNFYYCPGYESGASVFWGTTFKVTDTQLVFYIESSGFFSDTDYRFHYFIFKNDLQL